MVVVIPAKYRRIKTIYPTDFLLLELGVFSNLPIEFRFIGFKEKIKHNKIKNIRLEIETLIKVHIGRQGEPERIGKEISNREKIVRKAFEELREEQLIKTYNLFKYRNINDSDYGDKCLNSQ